MLKKEDNSYCILKEVPFPWVRDRTYAFAIEVRENQIRVFAGETCCLELQDNHRPYLHGMVGFALREGSQCFYNTLEIQPVSERSL